MSLYQQFETNKEAEVKGVKIQFAPNEDKTVPTFIISRMSRSNKKYVKRLEAATKPHRRQIELETLGNDVAEKINMTVFVDTILLGWSNVQNRKGENIPYSKTAATDLFLELPDLYDELALQSTKASLFRDEAIEVEAKN